MQRDVSRFLRRLRPGVAFEVGNATVILIVKERNNISQNA